MNEHKFEADLLSQAAAEGQSVWHQQCCVLLLQDSDIRHGDHHLFHTHVEMLMLY